MDIVLLRTQYVEGIYGPKSYTVTLKCRLRVIQGHWKWNHWIDYTRRLLVDLFDVIVNLKCGLEVTLGH